LTKGNRNRIIREIFNRSINMNKFAILSTAATALFVSAPAVFAQETQKWQDDRRLAKYVDFAKWLEDESGDIKKADDLVAKAIPAAVNEATRGSDKTLRLGEVIVSQMAAVEDWDLEKRTEIVRVIALESLNLAEGVPEMEIIFTKRVFATLYLVSKDSGPLYAAVDHLPDYLRPYARDAIENAQSTLGAPAMLAYRQLYNIIRERLRKDPETDNKIRPFIIDPARVTVTTTTTTSTTTTTTTSGLFLDGVPRPPATTTTTTTRPRTTTTTTTKPSVTPCGHR